MSFKALQSQAVRDAALQDAMVVRFGAELQRVYRRLTKLLASHLAEWDATDGERLTTTVENIARVFALRRQARRMLVDAGYDALAKDILGASLDGLAMSAIRAARVSVTMGPSLETVMSAWRDLRLADVLDVADDVARAIQRVALDGTLGLRPVPRLVLDVTDVLDLSSRQARTIVDTAVSAFSRQIEAFSSTGAEDEVFVYVGPIDDKARPFCRDWIGKVRTRQDIEVLDNGQLPNVFLSGGGYNCRHLWKRVSVLDEELIAIAGTDQRAPGVAPQLERVA